MLHFVPFFTIVRLPRMVFYTFAPQDVAADEGGSVEDMLSQCADAGVEVEIEPETLELMELVSKSEELCIKNGEFCIKNEEFCITNEECCIKNEELCINNEEFCIEKKQKGLTQQLKPSVARCNVLQWYSTSGRPLFSILPHLNFVVTG